MMFNIEDVIPRKQQGQCVRKVPYAHRKYAAERAKQTQKVTGIKCYVYKCKYCHMWHISHLKHEVEPLNHFEKGLA